MEKVLAEQNLVLLNSSEMDLKFFYILIHKTVINKCETIIPVY